MGNDFKIKISGDASSLKSEASGASGAIEDVGTKTEGAGKKAEGASKEFKKLTGEAGETRRVALELREIFPGLGTAMELVAGPEGAILALITGLLTLKSALEGSEKSSEELGEKLRGPEFAGNIEAAARVMADGAKTVALWTEKMEDAASSQDHLALAATSAGAALAATHSAQRTIAEAAFGLDEAKLRAQYEAGFATFEVFQAKLLASKISTNEKMLAADKDYRAKSEAVYRDELAAKTEAEPGAQSSAEASRANAIRARAKAKGDAQLLEDLKGRQAGLDKAVEDAEQAQKDRNSPGSVGFWLDFSGQSIPDRDKYFEDQITIARRNSERNAARVLQLGGPNGTTGRVAAEDLSAGLAEQRADRLEKIFGDLISSVDGLKQTLQITHSQNELANQAGTIAMRDTNAALIYGSPLLQEAVSQMPANVNALVDAFNMISRAIEGMNNVTAGRKPTF